MSAITPERIAELRWIAQNIGATIDWPKEDHIAVLDALESSRAEVQRLTEEARRSDAVEVPDPTCQNCVAKWGQFHGIPGRAFSDHERLSLSPQPSADVVVVRTDKSSFDRAALKMMTTYKMLRRESPRKPHADIGWMEDLLSVGLDALRSSTNHGAQDAGDGR